MTAQPREMRSPQGLTLGDCVALACALEASAPKVGNVHRSADFEDMSLYDFLISGIAIRRVFDEVPHRRTGQTVLAAVEATRSLVEVNTNLGLILMLAPLAKAAVNGAIREQITPVLSELAADDSREVYAAIRHANPGGLGEVDDMDIESAAPANLLDAMAAAVDRDLVARQYVNRFDDVFSRVADPLADAVNRGLRLTEAIVDTHVRLMAACPDSLIARKCGQTVAQQAATQAQRVIDAGEPFSEDYLKAAADFDFWLRADGHRRNPGTSADMIGAGLFVVLWEGLISPPFTT